MGETMAILVCSVASVLVGIGMGFDLARRKHEAEQEARVQRLMRDISAPPLRVTFVTNHPLWHRNSFAYLDELMPHVVEVSDD